MEKSIAIELIRSGQDSAWNAYRKEHTEWIPDLSGQDIGDANLARFDLCGADLRGADLSSSRLFAGFNSVNIKNASFDSNTRFPRGFEPVENGATFAPQVESHRDSKSNDQRHVFLSYCHDNALEAEKLYATLKAKGFDVWWDRDILPGADWKLERDRALANSFAVIACFSREVQQRAESGIYPELRDAIESYRNLPPGALYIIPVRFSPCRIPDLPIDSTRKLSDLQYVDVFPTQNWRSGIARLADSLNASRS